MLFIIHQAFELWFKQIRFELDYVCNVFRKEKINDNSEDLNLVVHRLNRVVKILDLLNEQWASGHHDTPGFLNSKSADSLIRISKPSIPAN